MVWLDFLTTAEPIAMTLLASKPETLGLDPARLCRLEQWLDQQLAQNRVAGASVLLARKGKTALVKSVGLARIKSDISSQQAFDRDTLVRLYSMTKPVTSVAAMMLFEQGHFQLDDPVAWYLPAFADTPVWDGTAPAADEVDPEALHHHIVPQQSPMTIRQLMTHTAGLTYSFMNSTPVDQYYRDHDLNFPGSSTTLADLVDRLACAPLLCQPGTQWNYSVASDVLGRLVEVWSGQALDDYLRDHIFQPLQMLDTGFYVEADKHHRFADLFSPASGGDLGSIAGNENEGESTEGVDIKKLSTSRVSTLGLNHDTPMLIEQGAASSFLQMPNLLSGGGGLVGSLDDFSRFCQMLLNGGELDGARLLSPRTVSFMRQNQLPGNCDIAAMGQPVWSESSYNGIGFGLGFAVVLDPVEAQRVASTGEYHWGGAASTFFWVDPKEDLFVIFLTQLYPSSAYPIRRELRTMVNQAIVD